jgi:hypothetical protein
MKMLRSIGFARVYRDAEVITGDTGNQFVQLIAEFEERTLYNGTTHAQRVQIRSFDKKDIARAYRLIEGAWILFSGDCDAVAEKGPTGWWYANPRVTGRILKIVDLDQGVARA